MSETEPQQELIEAPADETIMGDEKKADLVAITFDSTLDEIKDIGKETAMTAVTTEEQFGLAKAGLKKLVTARTSIEKRRVNLNRQVATVKKKIDDAAGILTAEVAVYEAPLKKLKEAWEAKEQAKADEEHKKAMVILDAITAKLDLIENLPKTVVSMTVDEAKAIQAKLEKTEITEELFGGRTEKAHWIKDAALLEIKAIVDGKVAHAEAAKALAEQAAEQKAEADRQAEQKKKLDAQQADIDRQAKKIADDAQAIKDAEAQAEKDRVAAAAKVVADKAEEDRKAKEATEAAAATEAARVAMEEAKAEAEAHRDATRPDREKVEKFANELHHAVDGMNPPYIQDNQLCAHMIHALDVVLESIQKMKDLP